MLYNKKLYEKHDALKIYLNCIENKLQIPSIIKNKNDYLLIIKYAYDNNWFDNSEELDVITISRKCRLHIYEAELTLKDASGNVVAAEVYTTGDDDIFNDYLDNTYNNLKDNKYIKISKNEDELTYKVISNIKVSKLKDEELASLQISNNLKELQSILEDKGFECK